MKLELNALHRAALLALSVAVTPFVAFAETLPESASDTTVHELQSVTLTADKIEHPIEQVPASVTIIAERTPEKAFASAAMTTSVATLPEVVVTGSTARKSELPEPYAGGQVAMGSRAGLLGNKDFLETPFATISYTQEFIQNIQAHEISRVIALTDPGVYNSGAGAMLGDSFDLRGFGLNASDVSFGGLYGVIPFWRVTPELAERIEVLKGPSALLNGMPPGGSVGGTINLVPKRAGDKPLARLTGTYASKSQFGMHADVGRRFGEEQRLGVRFNGAWRDGDGAIDHQSKKVSLAALGLDWRGDRVRLSADLYTGEDRGNGVNYRGISLATPDLPLPSVPKSTTLLTPDWTFIATKDKAIVLRGEVDIAPDLTAYGVYGRSNSEYEALVSSVATVFNTAGDYRNNFTQQHQITDKDSAELGLRAKFNTGSIRHEVALNGNYYHHDQKFGSAKRSILAQDWITNIYNPVWGPVAVDSSFNSAAIPKTAELRTTSFGIADTLSFAQDTVQVTIGVRHQGVVSDTWRNGTRTARYDASATTPAVALLIRATNNLSLYGNYIEGLSQGATAPLTASNAGEVFAPYKTKQQEIGAKYDLGSFATTLALFQIRHPGSFTDPVTSVFSFGGEQRNRGMEWGFFGEPVRGVRLLGGLSYTEAKLTKTAGGVNEGRFVRAAPKWQGKLGVEYDVSAVPGLTLSGNAVLVSKQYIDADNSRWAPGRAIYDIGTRYATTIAKRPVTLRATVQNVANKAYWTSGTFGRTGGAFLGLGAPRTFLLSATVDF